MKQTSKRKLNKEEKQLKECMNCRFFWKSPSKCLAENCISPTQKNCSKGNFDKDIYDILRKKDCMACEHFGGKTMTCQRSRCVWENDTYGSLEWLVKKQENREKRKQHKCYECPYQGEVGTCFGICLKEMIEEARKK